MCAHVCTCVCERVCTFVVCVRVMSGCTVPRPNDHSVFVTEEERDALEKLSHQIVELAANKIERFRPCFPFGQPKDDLKTNIKILSIVSRCVCVCVCVC